MIKTKTQERINKNLRFIRRSNRDLGVLRWGRKETTNHVVTKLLVALAIQKKHGEESCFMTEAIMLDGNRADVLDLVEGIAFEITESEGSESIERKKREYPYTVVAIRAGASKEEINKIVGVIE